MRRYDYEIEKFRFKLAARFARVKVPSYSLGLSSKQKSEKRAKTEKILLDGKSKFAI